MTTKARANQQLARPLAGLKGWVITTGMAGMDVQAEGVAQALGLAYEMKRVVPKGIWKFAAPWGPVAPSERFGEPGAQFSPPWPDVAISLGRGSVPYMRALRRRAGPRTFTVVMQDPKTGLGSADMIWVPVHDRLRGENVFTTLTAPHSFTVERLAELRRRVPPAIAALPHPRVTVILGGKNAVYKFRDEDDERFAGALSALGRLGASFLVTPSRRTHQRLLDVVEKATRDFPRLLWDRTGANPYGDFLAHADLLVVTADSVNMTGEACATGRPVLVFTPSGGSAKFRRFHAALQERGATRPLPEHLDAMPSWSYEPLHSVDDIAREIERRWLAGAAARSGVSS
ncbi:MAG TPA: mitochondrial fission ELM1 family protein [Hyphomicrobium sp.]